VRPEPETRSTLGARNAANEQARTKAGAQRGDRRRFPYELRHPTNEVKSRREAKDWCASHYPGSPVTEIGADRSPRIVVAAPLSLRGVQEDTKHGQAISRLVRPPSSPEIRSEIVTQLSSRIEGVRVYFQVKYLIVWIISCPLAKLPAIAVAASAINIGLTKVALLNAAVRAGLARPYAPGSPWRHPQCHVLRIG
jgi:hypothetical protein